MFCSANSLSKSIVNALALTYAAHKRAIRNLQQRPQLITLKSSTAQYHRYSEESNQCFKFHGEIFYGISGNLRKL